MKYPFIVNIAPIRGYVGETEEVERSGQLDELQTSGSMVGPDSPVSFKGSIEAIDGGIQVAGQIHADWHGECRRCLGKAVGPVDVAVRELFQNPAVEGESYPINGDNIDLEPLIREMVMLELPIAALCKEDCKGLCPTCGANWNETSCDCNNEVSDPRWAALDALVAPDSSDAQ